MEGAAGRPLGVCGPQEHEEEGRREEGRREEGRREGERVGGEVWVAVSHV